MRSRSLVVLLTAAGLLACATPAVAQDTPELDRTVDGVRVDTTGASPRIVFTSRAKRLFKGIAGRRASVTCETAPAVDGPLLTRASESQSVSVLLRVPKRRKSIGLSRSIAKLDVCRFVVQYTTRGGRTQETRVIADLFLPLTQAGAVYLDERETAQGLNALLDVVGAYAAKLPGGRYPTVEEVRAQAVSPAVELIAPLATPDDTPPSGQLGLCSDGARHVTAVAITSTGRRIFIDADDETVATNAPAALFGD